MAQLRPLSDCPGQIAPTAALITALWPGWYGPGGQGDALADITARATPGALPLGLIAEAGGEVLGTVALAETSYGAAGDSPWLIGLGVAPKARRQGIGAALIAGAEALARQRGAGALHTTTREAAGLFTARGWEKLREIEEGWAVYRLALGTSLRCGA